MAYWIGKSTLFLPKALRTFLAERISLVDVNNDISVLTEPNEKVCFFYADANAEIEDSTLLMALKICKNLSKSLVLYHKGNLPDIYLDSDLVYAHIDSTSEQALKRSSLVIDNLERDKLIIPINIARFGHPDTLSKPKKQKDTHTIQSAVDFIDNHFSENIRESDVALHCHLSTQYFSRTFHRVVGSSFRDYVASKRLELAKSLLLNNPRVQIADIAYQCGYNDVSYFSRVFKKKIGISPGTFRNFKGELKVT